MNRDLVAEYADLTRQMQDIMRRRNEVGELIEREKRTAALASATASEQALIDALFKIAKKRADWPPAKWGPYAEALGVSAWRLEQLFSNLMIRVHRTMPEHKDVLPRRIGPRSLARWSEWEPLLKKYKSTL